MGTEISGYILNRGSGMMQSTTFMGVKTFGYIFNQSSRMMQSYHIHGGRDLRIHFEPKFRDDAILPHSQGPRPLDTFWTEVQGWCNPTTFTGAETSRYILNRGLGMMQSTTFMGAETSGYILNRISGMMQSHHIHKNQNHRIYFGQMSQDDTMPLHSQGLRSLDHF